MLIRMSNDSTLFVTPENAENKLRDILFFEFGSDMERVLDMAMEEHESEACNELETYFSNKLGDIDGALNNIIYGWVEWMKDPDELRDEIIRIERELVKY